MLRLRELRKQKGITMKQLGEIVGVGESTISQYENGKRQPDYDTINQFADYFGVSVDYLLGRTDEKSPSLDEQLEGVEFALFGEIKELTNEQKQEILDFVRFKKQQNG